MKPPDRLWLQRSPDGSFDNRFIWTAGDVEYALVSVGTADLRDTVLRFEGSLIAAALKKSGGSVHRASILLHMKSHQALLYILNNRHKELLPLCTKLRTPRDGEYRELGIC